MLHGDAAAQRGDPVDIAVADGFGMVEEPVDALQGDIPVHLFIYVERAADRLVIGGVQAPGPFMLGQQADDRLQIAFHAGRHVRPGLAEILEVGGGIDQHLARAIVAISRDEKVTVLLVEQNSRMALSISSRAYAMSTGSVVLTGDSRELMGDDRIKAAYLGGDL